MQHDTTIEEYQEIFPSGHSHGALEALNPIASSPPAIMSLSDGAYRFSTPSQENRNANKANLWQVDNTQPRNTRETDDTIRKKILYKYTACTSFWKAIVEKRLLIGMLLFYFGKTEDCPPRRNH
jgi:hypothetical protein